MTSNALEEQHLLRRLHDDAMLAEHSRNTNVPRRLGDSNGDFLRQRGSLDSRFQPHDPRLRKLSLLPHRKRPFECRNIPLSDAAGGWGHFNSERAEPSRVARWMSGAPLLSTADVFGAFEFSAQSRNRFWCFIIYWICKFLLFYILPNLSTLEVWTVERAKQKIIQHHQHFWWLIFWHFTSYKVHSKQPWICTVFSGL